MHTAVLAFYVIECILIICLLNPNVTEKFYVSILLCTVVVRFRGVPSVRASHIQIQVPTAYILARSTMCLFKRHTELL